MRRFFGQFIPRKPVNKLALDLLEPTDGFPVFAKIRNLDAPKIGVLFGGKGGKKRRER
jgi:hypothetical protein